MVGLEPLLHDPRLIWAWGLAAVLAVAGVALFMRRRVQGRLAGAVVLLRLAAAAGMLVLMLNPVVVSRRPDPSRTSVSVLLDASGSMTVRDCPGSTEDGSRFAAAAGPVVHAVESALAGRGYRLRYRLFSDDVRSWTPGAPAAPGGRSAIGEALLSTAAGRGEVIPAAVVLISDGNCNKGMPLTEAAKRISDTGVPVTCIALGDTAPPPDLSVSGPERTLIGRQGAALDVSFSVQSTFSRAVRTSVVLLEGDRVLDRAELQVAADGTAEGKFRVVPDKAGMRVWTIRAAAPPGDTRPDDDVAFAAVRVRAPERFRILYLGGDPSWQYRFLRQAANEDDQIELSALLRLGKDVWFRSGPEGDAPQRGKPLPQDPGWYNRFDVIIARSAALAHLPGKVLEVLRDFVDRRGGGLLVCGPVNAVPPVLRRLLPVTTSTSVRLRERRALQLTRELALARFDPALESAGGSMFVGPGDVVDAAGEWKPGARPGLFLAGTRKAVLAAHGYGAGRVVWSGVDTSWRWRMEDQAGVDVHAGFWRTLAVWLGSTGKERVTSPHDGARVLVGADSELSVTVLGRDFRPTAEAMVEAVVTLPSGRNETVRLPPSPEWPGRYSAPWTAEEPGVYRVAFRVRLADETLERVVHIAANLDLGEMADTVCREDLLRDVARITGGRFLRWTDADRIADVPLRRDVPVREIRLAWADSFWAMAPIFLFLGIEWYIRRTRGLG